jgi:hypothetical protein
MEFVLFVCLFCINLHSKLFNIQEPEYNHVIVETFDAQCNGAIREAL